MDEQILRSLGMDECGLLREPRTWTLSLACEIARQDEVGEFTEYHWAIIRSLWDYYDKYRVAPPISLICVAYGW